MTELARVHRHESQKDIEFIASFAFLGFRLITHWTAAGIIIRIVLKVTDTWSRSLRFLFHNKIIGIRFHYNHLRAKHRDIEAVSILYQHDVLSLKACNLATANFIQKTYLITYLHGLLFFILGAKVVKKSHLCISLYVKEN